MARGRWIAWQLREGVGVNVGGPKLPSTKTKAEWPCCKNSSPSKNILAAKLHCRKQTGGLFLSLRLSSGESVKTSRYLNEGLWGFITSKVWERTWGQSCAHGECFKLYYGNCCRSSTKGLRRLHDLCCLNDPCTPHCATWIRVNSAEMSVLTLADCTMSVYKRRLRRMAIWDVFSARACWWHNRSMPQKEIWRRAFKIVL